MAGGCPGRIVKTKRNAALARSEPFRSLLDMAVLATAPAPVCAPDPAAAKVARVPLERRLDAVVLAAGATPPRGMRALALQALAPQALVPLRLEAPALVTVDSARHGAPATGRDTGSVGDGVPGRAAHAVAADAGFALPFFDEATRPDLFFGSTDEAPRAASASAAPAARASAPLASVSVAPVAGVDDFRGADGEGIRTRLRRLLGVHAETTPTRPLPAVACDALPRNNAGDKVLTFKTVSRHGVQVRAFSSKDTDDGIDLTIEGDGFDDPVMIEDRHDRAPAAVAIAALSDEGASASDPFGALVAAASAGSTEDLDTLGWALGLDGGLVVLRSAHDDDDLLFEDAVADAACGAGVDGGDSIALDDADIEVATDDLLFDDLPVTDPGLVRLDAACRAGGDDDADFIDDDEVTPPRGTPRPALFAPRAVRVVIEDSPARPRHDAISAEDAARNRLRARDLYLVALDDLGDGDTRGAMAHLQLAIAYDDQTELYQDLLSQLTRRLQRAS
jgi:hypothetical protein